MCEQTKEVLWLFHTLLGEKQVAPWMGRWTVAEHVLVKLLQSLINNNSF